MLKISLIIFLLKLSFTLDVYQNFRFTVLHDEFGLNIRVVSAIVDNYNDLIVEL